jgi:hypothetical protein
MLWLEKWGGLQAEEHHPNREAQGWQHHVVGVLCCRMMEIKAEINHSLYYYSDISHSSKKVVILTDLKQGIFTRIKCQNCEKLSLNVFG